MVLYIVKWQLDCDVTMFLLWIRCLGHMSEMKETNITVSQSASRRMIIDLKESVKRYFKECWRLFRGNFEDVPRIYKKYLEDVQRYLLKSKGRFTNHNIWLIRWPIILIRDHLMRACKLLHCPWAVFLFISLFICLVRKLFIQKASQPTILNRLSSYYTQIKVLHSAYGRRGDMATCTII